MAEYAIEGFFDSSSPTHDRRKSTPFNSAPTCTTLSEDSYNDNVRYTQYRIVPNSNVLLQADITTTSESPPDTLLALYCAPFDPENPADNLVAIDDDSNGFPNAGLTTRNIALNAGTNYYLVVISYSETFNAAGSYNLMLGDDLKFYTVPVDLDGDGIADTWEIEHFGDLDTANDVSDYDRDGYTDLQEYLNNLAGETDPADGIYDPKVRNVQDGTGYIPYVNGSDFWILMLPAILGESK